MSVCIRRISNKLSLPFIGSGKAVSPVDRQLTRNVKTTAFLEEFFAAGLTGKSETREPANTGHFLIKPLEATSNNVVTWNYKLKRGRNWSIGNNEKNRIEDITRRPLNEISMQNASGRIFSVAKKEKIVGSQNESGLQPSETMPDKPKEGLHHVYDVLGKDLPAFFTKPVDYSIYNKDIEFINNIKGTVTKGIHQYIKLSAMFRILGHFKFAYIKFDLLKITMHPEDNSVKVRWRIRGITGSNIFIAFWKYKVWNIRGTIDGLDSWYDGFSTFYVGNDGKVIKHVADKMMPDQDTEVSTKDKSGMAAKLALFLGLVTPREFLADISPLISCSIKLEESSDAACRETVDFSLEQIK